MKRKLRRKTPQSWCKQEGEPVDAYLAFVSYRDQTPPRSLQRVKVATNVHLPYAHVSAWSSTWHWGARVDAYDRHFEDLGIAEKEKVAKQIGRELATRHAIILHDAFEMLTREMSKFLRDSSSAQTAIFSPNELIRLMQKVIELQRLVNGDATENVSVAAANPEIEKLGIAELQEIDSVLRRAGAKS